MRTLTFFKCLVYSSKRRAAKRLLDSSIKQGDIEKAKIFARLSFQKLEFDDLVEILIKNIEAENISGASKTIKVLPEGIERGLLQCSCSEYFFKEYEKFSRERCLKEASLNYDKAELALSLP